MAITLTIAGVAKSFRVGTLDIKSTINGRTTANFEVRSNDGSYRPAFDDEVIIEHDATRIFSGLVDRVTERGVNGEKSGAYDAISTRIVAVDFNHYAERRIVNGTIPTGTLKSQFEYLRSNYLNVFSVTLDAGQVDGPTMPELIVHYRPLTDVFNQIVTTSNKDGDPFIWNISFLKVLSAFQPTSQPAPFDLTEANQNAIGDQTVEQTRQQYANRVFVKVPNQTQLNRVESLTGDGATSTFTLEYTLTKFTVGVIHVYESDGVTPAGGETFAVVGTTSATQWTYDPDTNQITRTIGATESGKIYKLTFDGEREIDVDAADPSATTDPYEIVVTEEEIPDEATAQDLADGALAKALTTPKTVRYHTRDHGVAPGQSQTITLPNRNLSGSFTIVDLDIKDRAKGTELEYYVTARSGTATKDGYREVVKLWSGDKLGSGGIAASPISAGPGGPVSSAAAPPLESVQFNDNGQFGGHASFTFDKATSTVMIGTGHTPGGADNLLVGEGHTVN